jgi:hypothetical protein
VNEDDTAFKEVWAKIEEYVQQCRYPINGPDPTRDKAKLDLEVRVRQLLVLAKRGANG